MDLRGELGTGSSVPAAKVMAPKVAPKVVPSVVIASFLARAGPVMACVCLEEDGALSSNCAIYISNPARAGLGEENAGGLVSM